jgi:hypothetical protein
MKVLGVARRLVLSHSNPTAMLPFEPDRNDTYLKLRDDCAGLVVAHANPRGRPCQSALIAGSSRSDCRIVAGIVAGADSQPMGGPFSTPIDNEGFAPRRIPLRRIDRLFARPLDVLNQRLRIVAGRRIFAYPQGTLFKTWICVYRAGCFRTAYLR